MSKGRSYKHPYKSKAARRKRAIKRVERDNGRVSDWTPSPEQLRREAARDH